MTAAMLLPMSLAVFAGAGTQRVTGLGFALVAGPLLTLLLGPADGVRLLNLLSLLSCLVVLPAVWREIDARQVFRLALPALLVLPVGAWAATRIPGGPLMVVEGVLVLAALYALRRFPNPRWLRGPAGAAGTGVASGLMNVTAGLGGPAMTLYATATGWERRSFVASMQLYSTLVNAGSITAKGLPDLPAHTLALSAVCVLSGAFAGHLISPHVGRRRIRQAVLAMAAAGGAAAIIKGVITL
ncbi:TSUP family transporter [Streptosporangium sp. NBC_01756]|uniref:TSUP family transporter n=1 Tax=Streptosporangium sp. NBC_01756 TaxID=2975950 RepID=UPI002DD85A86|nr:TSUP family transporter [Streptosporangium sp. NBC_01756]WSC86879.1 TSUP family transporter [Streptosporangium sp. NBC_01756]